MNLHKTHQKLRSSWKKSSLCEWKILNYWMCDSTQRDITLQVTTAVSEHPYTIHFNMSNDFYIFVYDFCAFILYCNLHKFFHIISLPAVVIFDNFMFLYRKAEILFCFFYLLHHIILKLFFVFLYLSVGDKLCTTCCLG